MTTVRSPFVQLMLAAITLLFIFGALSMIWPAILAVFLGLLLLLQSFSVDQDIVTASWTEIEQVSVVFGSLGATALLRCSHDESARPVISCDDSMSEESGFRMIMSADADGRLRRDGLMTARAPHRCRM